jgi:hypothetical protein
MATPSDDVLHVAAPNFEGLLGNTFRMRVLREDIVLYAYVVERKCAIAPAWRIVGRGDAIREYTAHPGPSGHEPALRAINRVLLPCLSASVADVHATSRPTVRLIAGAPQQPCPLRPRSSRSVARYTRVRALPCVCPTMPVVQCPTLTPSDTIAVAMVCNGCSMPCHSGWP